MHVEIQHIPTWEAIRKDWDILATQFPLLAAIFAPSSVLFDIPALTQHWISLNGVAVKTPHWTNVLSATGLALNIVANALLVARFSDVNRRVGVLATRLSAMFWILKATMELVNVSLFAHQNKDIPVADYQEGFWCAILSLMISGTVAIMLAYHCMSWIFHLLEIRPILSRGYPWRGLSRGKNGRAEFHALDSNLCGAYCTRSAGL